MSEFFLGMVTGLGAIGAFWWLLTAVDIWGDWIAWRKYIEARVLHPDKGPEIRLSRIERRLDDLEEALDELRGRRP